MNRKIVASTICLLIGITSILATFTIIQDIYSSTRAYIQIQYGLGFLGIGLIIVSLSILSWSIEKTKNNIKLIVPSSYILSILMILALGFAGGWFLFGYIPMLIALILSIVSKNRICTISTILFGIILTAMAFVFMSCWVSAPVQITLNEVYGSSGCSPQYAFLVPGIILILLQILTFIVYRIHEKRK